MTDRERLIDLIKKSENQEMFDALTADLDEAIDMSEGTQFNGSMEYLADYLIKHGVIVLPCKVGDTVYHLYPKQGIKSNKVKRIQVGTYGMMIADGNGVFRADEINKTVFLTREEAEKALNDTKQGESQ